MNSYITAETIHTLRERKGFTQKQLAEALQVSDKTISKWETGRGLPDITLLEPLAKALEVTVNELLSGEASANNNRSGNMRKAQLYVCPVCGNIITAVGEGCYSCCGITLPPLEAEEPDEAHAICVEKIENEWYITIDHPMTKNHYLTFAALRNGERLLLCKLYPEQDAAFRLPILPYSELFVYCNHHGLFRLRLTR